MPAEHLTLLRFLFLDGSINSQGLRPISWDDFFEQFDLLGLSFAYANEVDEEGGQVYEFQQASSGVTFHAAGNGL